MNYSKGHEKIILIVIALISISMNSLAGDNRGYEIAERVDKARSKFKTEQSKMSLLIFNAENEKVEKKINTKVTEYKDGKKTLIEFTWPSEVRGIKLLTWTHKKENNDQWLYLPALKKVRRISSDSQSGTFMGSAFSYEDLHPAELERYKYRYIDKKMLKKKKHWIIERVSLKENPSYSKERIWVEEKRNIIKKIEYYSLQGFHTKTAQYLSYKKSRNWWYAGRVLMKNHQTKIKSELRVKSIRLGKPLAQNIFHKNNLKN